MKYAISSSVMPQEKRKEINEKILYLIDNKIGSEINREDIFNAYTGEGGLHGLEFQDYESFHEYTEAKKEIEQGQFFTPHLISKFLVDCIKPSEHDVIADLTCGMGNFFNYLPTESNVYGCELDIKAYKVAKHLYPEANIWAEDIRYFDPKIKFDLVLGNPPFNLKWSVNKDEFLSQLFYCIKAYELLKPAGLLALIIPSSFLNDEFLDGGMIKEMNQRFNFICQFELPSDAFKQVGVDCFQTKMMFFQKKSEHVEDQPYQTSKILSPPLTEAGAEGIYQTYIYPVMEQKEKVKAKLFFENLHSDQADQDFAERVTKYLYDIKRNPKISPQLSKAQEYVNKYYNQEKPEGMKWDEWQKKRITKNKVLSYLKRIISNQHHQEVDKIELVKSSYGLRLKSYSRKKKLLLAKSTEVKGISFNDMILDNNYPFSDSQYKNVWLRKKREYKSQNRPMDELPYQEGIGSFLNHFKIYDHTEDNLIQFDDIQKQDLNKIMQKRYSILNWQQGSGKTLAGIAWYKYLFETTAIKNVFVVSAALSINMTWDVKLRDYKEPYITVRSLADIEQIQPGQIVLISFNMLIKYEKQIKKYVKRQSQKVALIVDESDELTNYHSQRTRATLNCFRKVQYKLLATGTTTRNSINELYPQLELLYNNSINLLSDCEYIYKQDARTKKLVEKYNDKYMCPFPAYKGQSLFKASYSPSKATVFGIKKDNQDIYNMKSLERLIKKTIITRKFKEIVGKDKYKPVVHRIDQNSAEEFLYSKIIKEFQQIVRKYFSSTGNYRKDSMLMIIRQIQLLIKSTSIPHKFKEYFSSELPNKYLKVFELLENFQDEKVAIGTVFLESATDYYYKLSRLFPERSIFLIKGDVSFNKRKQIIKDFEATTNGILISTQQSLKSSVNIPSCNKVIVESLQWNVPKIEQYYFRFIRYNSKDFKEVHFVTYNHTIEQNLLALLMVKERINEFIKTLDFKDQADIFEEYGIDLNVLDSIMEKEEDSEGKMSLTWGKQKVSV